MIGGPAVGIGLTEIDFLADIINQKRSNLRLIDISFNDLDY